MPLVVTAHGHTDLGKKRKVNEDSFAVDEVRGIAIVADGMGGHTAGKVASQTAVSIVREQLHANVVVFDKYRDEPTDARRHAAVTVVEKAIQHACERVFQLGQKDDKIRGMGTTIDVVVRAGDRAILGHVGDGRVYLVRGGQTYRLTKDHTIVAAQVEAGILTPRSGLTSRCRSTRW